MNESQYISLYQATYRRALLFAYRMVGGDWDIAKDCVSEAFIRIWNKRESVVEFSFTRVCEYVKMECLKYFEKMAGWERRNNYFYSSLPSFDEISSFNLIRSELFERIYQQSRSFPEAQKKVFDLLYIEGLDDKQISDRLNISPNTVYSQRKKIIDKILKSFGLSAPKNQRIHETTKQAIAKSLESGHCVNKISKRFRVANASVNKLKTAKTHNQ